MRVNTNPADILLGAINGAIGTALSRSDVDAQPSAAPAIAREVAKQVAPMVEHLTNNEPAIKSRVTQGAVGSILIASGTVLAMWTSGTLTVETLFAQLSIIGAAGWALYGRWVAKRPLGT